MYDQSLVQRSSRQTYDVCQSFYIVLCPGHFGSHLWLVCVCLCLCKGSPLTRNPKVHNGSPHLGSPGSETLLAGYIQHRKSNSVHKQRKMRPGCIRYYYLLSLPLWLQKYPCLAVACPSSLVPTPTLVSISILDSFRDSQNGCL